MVNWGFSRKMHKGGCRLWEATMDREIFAREISSKRKRLEDLAQQIWENPEEPFQETIAASRRCSNGA